jgi:Protein of unknown function (DUF3106)
MFKRPLVAMLVSMAAASFAAVQPQSLSLAASHAANLAAISKASPGTTTAFAGITKIAAAAGDAPKPWPATKTDKPAAKAGNFGAAAVSPDLQSKPLWAELTPAQQVSLKPLAAKWASLTEAHKRKWIALAQNYPKMSTADQSRMHSRMTEWVTLSPQQRNQARLNFAETKKLSAEEKTTTWQAYQALSPEEKKRLASKGNQVPPGATSAVKPVPAQKLAVVPSTRKDPKPAQMAAHQPKVAPNTLLPQAPGAEPGATAPK